ncbi:Protopine 6-monooxygenase [Hibiscus syriacus]|uniref:Protopine 6-monooxygenase n=1 Tax=Hibiscus syriacus TaxID=106335 RepID=A0A6A3CK25_HIBSY|nr:xanthotoxin 5-hydroxylase CYP82C4-like [Hibiscus syriacus]KAE8729735.1 Protopine 6-monooxygenase [Hibiscus syriacus]
MKRIAKEFDTIFGKWVNEHRKKRLGESVEGDKDFINVLFSVMDNDSIPIEEANTTIKATCLSLVLGSIDAITIAFTWAVSLPLKNRRVLKKAQDELDLHVGKHRQVEESDINNLVYLQAIMKETFRLHPPAPLSAPREAMEDCTIAGFPVAAGTSLLLNVWKLQRDPGIWEKPSDFLPERFVNDHANIDVRGQNFELLPFGSGRRICPGISFALQVLHLALARFLHGFKLGTVSDNSIDMSESAGMAVRKATPLEVTLTSRLPVTPYG